MDKTAQKSSSHSQIVPLPTVGTLFSDSWENFKKSVVLLITISVVSWLVSMLLWGVGIFIAFAAIGVSFLPLLQSHMATPNLLLKLFNPATVGILVILLLVLIIVASVIGAIFQAALIYAVDSDGKISFGEAVSKGMHRAIPLFLVGLLVGILAFGGFLLFIIPGIVISIFFTFAIYEVVLGERNGVHALQRSAFIVKNNFWEILGRILLLAVIVWVVVFAIGLLINLGVSAKSPGSVVTGTIVRFLIQYIVSWYAISYGVTLYKQARQTVANEEANITWMWVVSIVGWILGILLFYGIIALVTSPTFQKMLQNSKNSPPYQNSQNYMQNTYPTYFYPTSGSNSNSGSTY